jgi:cation transport ATPase
LTNLPAGVSLVKGDLAGIARGLALSRATMHNIRENLVLTFVSVIGNALRLRAARI